MDATTRQGLAAVTAVIAAGAGLAVLGRRHPSGTVVGGVCCISAADSTPTGCPEGIDIALRDAAGHTVPVVLDDSGGSLVYRARVAPGAYTIVGGGAALGTVDLPDGGEVSQGVSVTVP